MKATPVTMQAVAALLIAAEASGSTGAETNAHLQQTFGAAVEKLRRPLGALIGTAGYRSLLWRALSRAEAKVRWLCNVRVRTNGTLEFPTEMSELGKAEWAAGELALTTQLLDLLGDFIGEPLTLRLLQDVWPEKASGIPASITEKK